MYGLDSIMVSLGLLAKPPFQGAKQASSPNAKQVCQDKDKRDLLKISSK
jgi:hypothetical protein